MNVVLIGFKSCGKSTVGRILADQRQLTFVDLDDVIVGLLREKFNLEWNCWEFYFSYGAEKFRELETEAVRRLRQKDNMVLATGGGAPLTPENREELAALGTLCYIKALPELLFKRMQQNKMPAYLTEKPTLANLRRIWFQRDSIYEKLADITVEAAENSPEQIADEISQALQ